MEVETDHLDETPTVSEEHETPELIFIGHVHCRSCADIVRRLVASDTNIERYEDTSPTICCEYVYISNDGQPNTLAMVVRVRITKAYAAPFREVVLTCMQYSYSLLSSPTLGGDATSPDPMVRLCVH